MRIAFLDPLEGRLTDFPARYLPEHETLTTAEKGRLPDGVETAEGIVWQTYPLDADLINRLPKLRFLQRIGYFRATGNAEAALARGIPVAVTPYGVMDRVAQHAMAHTLSLMRQLPAGHEAVLNNVNPDNLPEEETGAAANRINWARIPNIQSLNDKTVGILGFGEIGACYARMLHPFCCRVLACKRRPLSPEQQRFYGVENASLDTVLAESDVIASFVPYSEDSRKMLGEAQFRKMKPGAYFVNCGRGNTIDEEALIRALREGWIAGAGLDVFAVEPLPADSPLRSLKNVILTPHSAGGVLGWIDTFQRLAENLRRVQAGREPILPMRPGDLQPA